jgi:uncharacterized coiled-coil protein SlyX
LTQDFADSQVEFMGMLIWKEQQVNRDIFAAEYRIRMLYDNMASSVPGRSINFHSLFPKESTEKMKLFGGTGPRFIPPRSDIIFYHRKYQHLFILDLYKKWMITMMARWCSTMFYSPSPTSLSNKRDMSMQTDSGMGASESDVQRLQELENKFVLQEKARHSLLNTISSLNDEIARYQQEISVLKDKENKSKDKLNINVTVTNNNNKKEKEKADSAEHILLAKEYEKTIVDLKLQMERYEKERAAKASKQVATPSPKKLKSSSSRKELFANLALECKDLIGEERTRLRQDSTQIQMQLAQYQHEMAATVSKLLERLRQSEEKWRNKLAQVTNTNSADAQAHANQMHALTEECEGLRRTVTRLESEINAAQQVNNFVASKRTPTKEAIQSPAHHIKPKTPSSTGRPSNNNNELLFQQQKELQQQLQQHQQQVLLLQQQLQQLQQQHNHTIAQLQQTINQQQFQIHSQRTEMEHSIEYFKRSAVEKQALVDVRDDTIGNMRINIQLLGEQLEMVPDKHALELKCTQHHAHVKDLGRVAAIRELTIERDSLFDELKRAK